jgi:hypothetical protein
VQGIVSFDIPYLAKKLYYGGHIPHRRASDERVSHRRVPHRPTSHERVSHGCTSYEHTSHRRVSRGVYLTDMHLIGIYLMGMHLRDI